MRYLKKAWNIIDNYALSRLLGRVSTSSFWYLQEPVNFTTIEALQTYLNAERSPIYFIDYTQKLQYPLKNEMNIVMLQYDNPIGKQLNPEAAFQYALGLHDQYIKYGLVEYKDKFLHYANYFLKLQSTLGLWPYQFDWLGSKAPWYSALAQSRGASVMLRAYLITNDIAYLHAAKNALKQFNVQTTAGGFLHPFSRTNCYYFEEYPETPTGVLNGFMAALMGVWELMHWTNESAFEGLWRKGIVSLELMLPYYTTDWWSLYDLDEKSPIKNVNSPRYHLLEIAYLQILSLLSNSSSLKKECLRRQQQYQNKLYIARAYCLKLVRKVMYQ